MEISGYLFGWILFLGLGAVAATVVLAVLYADCKKKNKGCTATCEPAGVTEVSASPEGVLGTQEYYSSAYKETVRVFTGPDTITDQVRTGELWEPDLTAEIAAAVRPGTTFLDIGANMGFTTLGVWSSKGKPEDIDFVMVEMQAEAGSLCKYNTRNIQHRALHHMALADRTGGFLTYSLGHDNNGGTHGVAVEASNRDQLVSRVPLVALDELEFQRPVSVIRADIEGAEAVIFGPGADEFWASQSPDRIFVEIFPHKYAQISRLIEGRGYEQVSKAGDDYVYQRVGAMV